MKKSFTFKTALYILLQCTWGVIQTLAGLAVFLVNINRRHYLYHGAIVTEWESFSSVSLGLFLFVHAYGAGRGKGRKNAPCADRELVVHEYGHTIQSLFLGPMYLIVIGLPSLLWAILPKYIEKRRNGVSYDAFWTEKSANALGESVTHEASFGDKWH